MIFTNPFKPSSIQALPSGEFQYRDLRFLWKKRSGTRKISISIFENTKLCLMTNHRPGMRQVERFLDEHYSWIVNQLSLRQKKVESARREGLILSFQAESKIPFLGKAFTLKFQGKSKAFDFKSGILCLPQDYEGKSAKIRRALIDLYKIEATSVLKHLQKEVSLQMGVEPINVKVRDYKARWGSCSSKGEIHYNWKLVAAPLRHIKYVVVHETAHLTELNHSVRFWKIVSQYCPDYKDSIQWLGENHLYFEFLSAKSPVYKEGM